MIPRTASVDRLQFLILHVLFFFALFVSAPALTLTDYPNVFTFYVFQLNYVDDLCPVVSLLPCEVLS